MLLNPSFKLQFLYVFTFFKGSDPKLISAALEMLKYLIRTSTTSMTSVPKPLKYMAQYYLQLKNAYERMTDPNAKKLCADIISVLAMAPVGKDNDQDCLKYCMLGSFPISFLLS